MSSTKMVGRWSIQNPTPEQEKAMERLDEYIQGPWEHYPLTHGDVVWKEGNSCIVVCQVLPGVERHHALGGVQRSLVKLLSTLPDLYALATSVANGDEDLAQLQKTARTVLDKAHNIEKEEDNAG